MMITILQNLVYALSEDSFTDERKKRVKRVDRYLGDD